MEVFWLAVLLVMTFLSTLEAGDILDILAILLINLVNTSPFRLMSRRSFEFRSTTGDSVIEFEIVIADSCFLEVRQCGDVEFIHLLLDEGFEACFELMKSFCFIHVLNLECQC